MATSNGPDSNGNAKSNDALNGSARLLAAAQPPPPELLGDVLTALYEKIPPPDLSDPRQGAWLAHETQCEVVEEDPGCVRLRCTWPNMTRPDMRDPYTYSCTFQVPVAGETPVYILQRFLHLVRGLGVLQAAEPFTVPDTHDKAVAAAHVWAGAIIGPPQPHGRVVVIITLDEDKHFLVAMLHPLPEPQVS